MAIQSRAPFFSVVVPVYNVRAYLADCLASICSQDYQDIEIICIDDGSTDGSDATLDALACSDERIYVHHQENQGVSAARNVGLEVARGTYVIFVDGDDCLLPGAVSRIRCFLEEQDFDIAVFGGTSETPARWVEEILGTRDAVFEGSDCGEALFHERGCIPFLWNKVYRRDFLVDYHIRFNDELSLGEDCAFQFLAFPLAHRVMCSTQQIYWYRNGRPGSVMERSIDNVARQQTDNVAALRYIFRVWEEHGWLAGHEADLLCCLAFLFHDAIKLSSSEFFILMRTLNELLGSQVTSETFQNAETDVRLFYQTVLRVGNQRTARTFGAQWGMLTYRFYRIASDIKNGGARS